MFIFILNILCAFRDPNYLILDGFNQGYPCFNQKHSCFNIPRMPMVAKINLAFETTLHQKNIKCWLKYAGNKNKEGRLFLIYLFIQRF